MDKQDVQNKTWIVYQHLNKINGKCYIGITSNATKNRWGREGKGYKTQYFFKAIKKYGWENFEHIILEKDIKTLELANDREKYWIKHFHSCVLDKDSCGYNADFGGGCLPVSEVTKQKISKSLKGKPSAYKGKKASDELRRRLSVAHKGQVITKETREKISKSTKGKLKTKEHALHISEGKKGKPLSDKQLEQLKNLHEKMRLKGKNLRNEG